MGGASSGDPSSPAGAYFDLWTDVFTGCRESRALVGISQGSVVGLPMPEPMPERGACGDNGPDRLIGDGTGSPRRAAFIPHAPRVCRRYSPQSAAPRELNPATERSRGVTTPACRYTRRYQAKSPPSPEPSAPLAPPAPPIPPARQRRLIRCRSRKRPSQAPPAARDPELTHRRTLPPRRCRHTVAGTGLPQALPVKSFRQPRPIRPREAPSATPEEKSPGHR